MNRLMSLFEAGRQKVAGMKMLMPIHETALFQVKVRGVIFEGAAMKVRVEPVDGTGEITVEPNQLVDDTKEARELYFRRTEAAQFRHKHRHTTYSAWGLRGLINTHLPTLSKADQAKVQEAMNGKKIGNLDKYAMQSIWSKIVNLKFNIDRDGEEIE